MYPVTDQKSLQKPKNHALNSSQYRRVTPSQGDNWGEILVRSSSKN